MDPLAHTLFGATLAEAGLKKISRYATPTLLIGANLPDIDAAVKFIGSDASLYWRRGWTHGVLAMIVLPLLLWGLMLAWHRWRGGAADAPPLRRWQLLGIAYLAVWSHPLLDWLNTYGVRFLMPFDGTWFYGDTLFIVDPWFWLLTAAGVVLARTTGRLGKAGWSLLAGLTSVIILTTDMVPPWVKVLWLLGLAIILTLRLSPVAAQKVAQTGLVTLLLYIGCMVGLANLAESSLQQDYPQASEIQANPMPANPLSRRMVVVEEDRYTVLDPRHAAPIVVARQVPDEIVMLAMADPSVRGFMNWVRYPYWHVIPQADGWRVNLRDLRYTNPGEPSPGIGSEWVFVPREAID